MEDELVSVDEGVVVGVLQAAGLISKVWGQMGHQNLVSSQVASHTTPSPVQQLAGESNGSLFSSTFQ